MASFDNIYFGGFSASIESITIKEVFPLKKFGFGDRIFTENILKYQIKSAIIYLQG